MLRVFHCFTLKSCDCLLAKSLWKECASSNPSVFSFQQLEVSTALQFRGMERSTGPDWPGTPNASACISHHPTTKCWTEPFLPSHFRPTLQIYAHDTFGRMRVEKLERLQVFSVSLAFFSSCRRQRSASS